MTQPLLNHPSMTAIVHQYHHRDISPIYIHQPTTHLLFNIPTYFRSIYIPSIKPSPITPPYKYFASFPNFLFLLIPFPFPHPLKIQIFFSKKKKKNPQSTTHSSSAQYSQPVFLNLSTENNSIGIFNQPFIPSRFYHHQHPTSFWLTETTIDNLTIPSSLHHTLISSTTANVSMNNCNSWQHQQHIPSVTFTFFSLFCSLSLLAAHQIYFYIFFFLCFSFSLPLALSLLGCLMRLASLGIYKLFRFILHNQEWKNFVHSHYKSMLYFLSFFFFIPFLLPFPS